MKTKLMVLWVWIGVLAMVLATGYNPVVAAPPTGEVKIAMADIGVQIPLPHIERGQSVDWMGLLYDPLVGCDSKGELSPELGLANKWEMSPDGLTWTFYLRKGVKFHDGVELTAKDLKFSIELSMGTDATIAETAYIREYIKSIDVKEPYTVVIHCKKPSIFTPTFLSNMEATVGMVVPKEYYERLGKDEFIKRPIGSGPYKWHSQMIGSFVKLEATEKHWRDGVPRYKYMTYLVIPEESTRMAMLRTGEADIARISRGGVKEALSAGLNVVTKENAAVIYFRPNMQWTSPVFSDIRFRKALNLAVDKKSIIKNLFGGLANPIATFPGSHISVSGGNPTLKPYPYDPQEGRRLIKEGGWEGYEFTLPSYIRPGCPEFPLVVEAIAGYWDKVGLKPKIRMIDWAIWSKAMSEQKTQNSIHGADVAKSPDVYGMMGKFMDMWYFAHQSRRSTVNIPELEERFERIGKSLDIAEISKLMTEIDRYVYDNYLNVPICEIPDMLASTKRIPRWDPGTRRLDKNYYDLIRQR
jgi:peptide/nickel transport system substrate-binding protein